MIVYDLVMDAIAGLLDGPRARGAFVLRLLVDPPWALAIEDEAPLALLAVVRGHVVVRRGDMTPIRLEPGTVALIRGPEHHVIADDAATPPQVRILPGEIAVGLDGRPPTAMNSIGVRTYGNAVDGGTLLVVGIYERAGEVSQRLLRALPPLLVIEAEKLDAALVGLFAVAASRDEPGQEAVLDRLLDLVLIAVLRAFFAGDAAGGGWYRAHADPVVGPALQAMQHDPARAWTVASLARVANVSRATFARRFAELVGETPMAFLTAHRLALAADLLLEPGATLASVAARVGYGGPFALSTAFRRERGVSPARHRAAAG